MRWINDTRLIAVFVVAYIIAGIYLAFTLENLYALTSLAVLTGLLCTAVIYSYKKDSNNQSDARDSLGNKLTILKSHSFGDLVDPNTVPRIKSRDRRANSTIPPNSPDRSRSDTRRPK